MKRISTVILLTSSIWSSLGIIPVGVKVVAQNQKNGDLFYLYQGQRISLNQRQDAIAVSFKKIRTRGLTGQPLYLQLQQDLQGGMRGTTPPKVSPLGENYALVNLPKDTQDDENGVERRIKEQPYVQTTLPVLTRSQHLETIVLPNEIIISFEPQLTQNQRQVILQQNHLEIVRPLRFNRDRYLVRSTSATGIKILNTANDLNSVKGVVSAAPNFIESLTSQSLKTASKEVAKMKKTGDWLKLETADKSGVNRTAGTIPPSSTGISPTTNLLGFAWHLDSTPLKQCLQQEEQQISGLKYLETCLQKSSKADQASSISRTDMRVADAWKHSNGGKGVVVAVIDSLIQWDHPDLIDNVYTVTTADKCPEEVHGWDFSSSNDSSDPCENGDPDTRISPTELAILRARFQDTFQLTDAKLVEQYPEEALEVKQENPDDSLKEIADVLRYDFRTYKVGGEFHGTFVSGTIAAQPHNDQGMVGVAPNAKILPVRIFGLDGSFSPSAYIEAIGYAADRGADVINLSLGSSLPSPGEKEAIADVLRSHPKLVIVAAAGNENMSQVSYPAAYDGVIAVGATNITGNRTSYSNYGKRLDVVAPGGDFDTPGLIGGIPATGGTWLNAFWEGLPQPKSRWSSEIDPRGKYWWVQGTSFSSPAVAGVVALMKGENQDISREKLMSILKSTASYQGLTISDDDDELYRSQRSKSKVSASMKEQQFFFGKGLVNANAAVDAVKTGH